MEEHEDVEEIAKQCCRLPDAAYAVRVSQQPGSRAGGALRALLLHFFQSCESCFGATVLRLIGGASRSACSSHLVHLLKSSSVK